MKISPKSAICLVVLILASLLPPSVFVRAEPSSEMDPPVGLWETIDDKSGKTHSWSSRYSEENATLFRGMIEAVLTLLTIRALSVAACTE